MWKDAALITLSCTLFVQMGLSEAIQEVLHVHVRVLSCHKCATFWACLLYLLLTGCRVVDAVVVSFLFAYISLWLALGYDALARIYNKLYERITETPCISKDAADDYGEDDNAEADADEVQEVQ